ncbi:MAG TPA: hypothetical protein VFC19_11175 [Candidatus Limnocylindrales bacterium]|nr:hypothetical protein [Candidatus Limnocylindrales bacterium]
MGVDRRGVLRAGGLAGAVGVVLGLDSEPDALPAGGLPKLKLRKTPTFTKALHRRADQMSIRLEFYNLTLLKKGQPGPGDPQQARLVRVDPTAEAFIVVDFGPQHLAEHAYDEATMEVLEVPTTRTMLAGSSRLAFKVPSTPLPYTFGSIMAWKSLLPSLAPHAKASAPVKAPEPTETALEVPWKVVLSPDQNGKWSHAMVPEPGPGGRSVLWHARLDVTPGAGGKARVIWTPDLENAAIIDPPVPGRTSLRPEERRNLVKLTSKWDQLSGAQTYVPQPIDVDQLALSSSGAWLKSKGVWEIRPDGVDLKEWLHVATMGRDHFVKVVDAGRAWPIRHRLELITITERKFEIDPNGKPVAALRQRIFLVPRDRELTYEACDIPPNLLPHQLRDLPLKKIRILTKSTPNLAPFDLPSAEPGTQIPVGMTYYGRDAFWPRVGGPGNWADFMWDLEAEDYEGRTIRFAVPLIYVSDSFGKGPNIQQLKTYYESPTVAARRTADLGGQKVALARFANSPMGETAYPLKTFTFGCNVYTLEQPLPGQHFVWGFTPYMLEAGAKLDAVDRIRGGAATTPQAITLHPIWISDGDNTNTNPARVFAALASPVSLSYNTNASGGVAAPDMKISALSAITGPMDAPNPTTTVPSQFDPADFFGGADPMVLGAIHLIEILQAVAFPSPGTMSTMSGPEVPRLVTTEIEGGVLTSLTWETSQLKDILDLFIARKETPEGTTNAKLALSAKAYTYYDGRAPSTTVEGELTNFTVAAVGPIIHVIDLKFNKFGFVSKDGSKPDVSVSIYDVVFVGPLEFVNVLRKFMGGDGIGGGGPQAQGNSLATTSDVPANGGYVNLTPQGIQAGFNLTLPPVACGVLLLQNISFGARADLFFDGSAMRLRFNFAERNNPFTLTVMCFGGGGSAALTLGLDLFELFELTFEFGAKLALDIGVASGSISAMAGIYLAIGDSDGNGTDDGVRLTGYLRLNGELNILGIIRLALEFYLAFTYISGPPKHIYGEAQLTVEIEVLFFSASVTLGPIKKTFEGGDDPESQGQIQAVAVKAGAVKAGAVKKGASAMAAPPAIAANTTPKTFADMTSAGHWADYTAMYDPAAF